MVHPLGRSTIACVVVWWRPVSSSPIAGHTWSYTALYEVCPGRLHYKTYINSQSNCKPSHLQLLRQSCSVTPVTWIPSSAFFSRCLLAYSRFSYRMYQYTLCTYENTASREVLRVCLQSAPAYNRKRAPGIRYHSNIVHSSSIWLT